MHSMPLQNILDKIRGEKTDGKWLHVKFILHRSHHKCEDKKRFITWCLQKSKYNLIFLRGGGSLRISCNTKYLYLSQTLKNQFS